MTATFNNLKHHYPTQSKADFFTQLGGQWPKLINNPNYNNTCATRLSYAFNSAGDPVPQKYREAIDGAGNSLILKVKTMDAFIEGKFGKPSWGMSKEPGRPITKNDLPRESGIIVYHAAWSDATGHFDLWTGSSFIGSGNFDDIRDGFDIAMWFLK